MGDPVNLTGGVVKLTGRVFTDEQGGWSPVTPPLVNGDQVTTTEPCSYPTPPPPAIAVGAAAQMKQVHRGGGSELCFPKTVSEAERQALEQQVAGLNHDNAQQVLRRARGRHGIKQIRNPIRYCAALVARLRRGQFKPELGLEVADRRAAEQQREAGQLCSARATESARGTRPPGVPAKVRRQVDRMRSGCKVERPADISGSDESVDPPTGNGRTDATAAVDVPARSVRRRRFGRAGRRALTVSFRVQRNCSDARRHSAERFFGRLSLRRETRGKRRRARYNVAARDGCKHCLHVNSCGTGRFRRACRDSMESRAGAPVSACRPRFTPMYPDLPRFDETCRSTEVRVSASGRGATQYFVG